MGTIKRAFLYVTRKKGKSILLFFILLVMATFVLTGLSIEKSSQAAQKNLREALGGEFQIVVDLSENNPYARRDNDGEGNVELYTEYPITREIIDTVMTVNGIERYDAATHTLVFTNLDIFPGNVPMKADFNNLIYARTVIGTENNNFFQSEKFKLIEGTHITGNESNVAIISKDLADKNDLKLGDTISLQSDNSVNVNIIGIYEILKPDSPFENIVTYEKAENQIFIDFHTLQSFGDMPMGFDSVTFNVYDPAQLNNIVSEVNNLSSIDWRAFNVTTNNETYLEAAAPLQKIQTLVTTMIFVITLVSAIILSLVLTMWGRSRIHETGVFLSLGIGKTKIISQYLTEVLMIAVLAFGFSYLTSNAVVNQMANGLLQQNTPANEQQTDGIVTQIKDGYSSDDISITIKDSSALSDIPQQQETKTDIEVSEVGTETDEEQLHVTVDIYNMLQLYMIGVVIIILSVGVSSLTVMRLKPREILSKMS